LHRVRIFFIELATKRLLFVDSGPSDAE